MRLPSPHRFEIQDLDRDEAADISDERFDRVRFALEAVDRLRPKRLTIVVVEGPRLRVESGRAWGRAPGSRWAMLAVPRNASRRAIAMAIAALGGVSPDPYTLDLLLRA